MGENAQVTKDELLKLAKRRVILKKAAQWHVALFLIVNAFLCVIYYLTTPSGYFWPLWSIAGWGIAVVIHVVVTAVALSSMKGQQSSVEKEYQKLLNDYSQNKDS